MKMFANSADRRRYTAEVRSEEGRFWPIAAALAVAWAICLALIVQTTVPTDVGWYLVSTG